MIRCPNCGRLFSRSEFDPAKNAPWWWEAALNCFLMGFLVVGLVALLPFVLPFIALGLPFVYWDRRNKRIHEAAEAEGGNDT